MKSFTITIVALIVISIIGIFVFKSNLETQKNKSQVSERVVNL